jgi:hypothetical protein
MLVSFLHLPTPVIGRFCNFNRSDGKTTTWFPCPWRGGTVPGRLRLTPNLVTGLTPPLVLLFRLGFLRRASTHVIFLAAKGEASLSVVLTVCLVLVRRHHPLSGSESFFDNILILKKKFDLERRTK